MSPDRELHLVFLTRDAIPTRNAHGILGYKTCAALASRVEEITFLHPFRWKQLSYGVEDFREEFGLETVFPRVNLPCLDLPPLKLFSRRLWFWVYAITYGLAVLLYLLYRHKIRQERFVVYSMDFPVSFGLLALKPFLDVPHFLEVHDLPGSFRAPRRRILQRADGLVVNGPHVQTDLLEQGFDEATLRVIPNGVSLDRYSAPPPAGQYRRELDLPSGDYLVGYTGTLSDFNGIPTLLEVARATPSVRFLTVGGTTEQIERIRTDHGVPGNFNMRSFVPPAEVPRYQQACDVLILPLQGSFKRVRRYATPTKLFEYMAAGVPIVASNLPSIRQVLTDGETALLCDPSDSGSFVSVLEHLREHPDEGEKLARNARQRARQFTWTNRARRIENFVRERSERFGNPALDCFDE